jgi:hypothetical protein
MEDIKSVEITPEEKEEVKEKIVKKINLNEFPEDEATGDNLCVACQ